MLRLTHIFIIFYVIYVYFQGTNTVLTSLSPSPFTSSHTKNLRNEKNENIECKFPSFEPLHILNICLINIVFILSLFMTFLQVCNTVTYVTFATNLTLFSKKKAILKLPQSETTLLSLLLLGLLSAESENYFSFLVILLNLDYRNLLFQSLEFRKILSQCLFVTISIYIFYTATTSSACILCLLVLQNLCLFFTQHYSHCLQILLILLSNDVHQNPGPRFHNSFFTFMTWNVNSLAKDNFKRVDLIESVNSIFNYDLIAICETSLNDSIKLPDKLLNNYTFVSSENPTNTRHGGVGLFYKNSLPIKIRNDLSFEDSIVAELNFGRRKLFFTVMYRSPAFNHISPEFLDFLSNFTNLYSKMKSENPFATFFSGDFNGHSQLWWPEGDSTAEGREIENLLSSLGLYQLISEPTNFEPNKNPSCIDLIITDQPNLVLDSGTRDSLDSFLLSPQNNLL